MTTIATTTTTNKSVSASVCISVSNAFVTFSLFGLPGLTYGRKSGLVYTGTIVRPLALLVPSSRPFIRLSVRPLSVNFKENGE